MARRSGPIHVATTTRRYKDKVYTTHLLRRTYREDGKVKHETLGNISHLPPDVITMISGVLKGETYVSAEAAFDCVRSLPHGHVSAVLGYLRKIGLDKVIAAKRSRERDLVMTLIVARIIDPRSKLATARGIGEETAFSSLGEVLDVSSCNENDLYEAMDWLLPKQAVIEKKLAKRHLSENTLVLYDVTSSYFEGRKCPLAARGHDRDGKKGKLQIVIGLLCNKEGCPIAVEVFNGNTGDPATVSNQVQKIRQRFGLNRVVLVGDRGMLTEARIREEIEPVEGLSWISALRAPAIKSLIEKGTLQRSLFDEQDLAEISSPDFPGERLIACLNPLLEQERRRKREELLQATERELDKIVKATQRQKRPLRGIIEIGIRLGKVLNRRKVGKHFKTEITDNSFSYRRNTKKIEEEKALDGIYIIRTDVPKEVLDSSQTVRSYKKLSVVERAFRCMKTVDLKVRPIHHHLDKRVRSHVFMCMLAYYVEWHMRQLLAPVLFDDDDPESAKALRTSEVAPAQRSPSAKQKAFTKKTQYGAPVHSFQTLLKDLATIVKNKIRQKQTQSPTFEMTTLPTPIQQRAFDLLGVSHRL